VDYQKFLFPLSPDDWKDGHAAIPRLKREFTRHRLPKRITRLSTDPHLCLDRSCGLLPKRSTSHEIHMLRMAM